MQKFEGALRQGIAAFQLEPKETLSLNYEELQLSVQVVDLVGLECPEPLMMLRQALKKPIHSDYFMALATDISTKRDFRRYCEFSGLELLAFCVEEGVEQPILGFLFRY